MRVVAQTKPSHARKVGHRSALEDGMQSQTPQNPPFAHRPRARGPQPAELPPYPDGWYAVGLASELAPGGLMSRTFCGNEIVLFRTSSGEVAAVDAYCPHLGAHLGCGGRVSEETIECPFHAFRFDTKGTCVATGYGTKPPPKAVLGTWPVLELNHWLLVWFDSEGLGPAWQPPALEWDGWTAPAVEILELESHPQETTENSVDLGHLSVLHFCLVFLIIY